MLVETVVNDLPAESFGEPRGERRPERALHEDRDLVEPEAIAGRCEGVGRAVEREAVELAVRRVFPPHARDREERHPRSDADRVRGLPFAFEGAVENAPSAPRERGRQLLRPLAAIGPCDHRQHDDVGAAGPRLRGVELEPWDVHGRLAEAEELLRREPPPDRSTPCERYDPAPERVEATPEPLLPIRFHVANRARI